MRPISLFLAGLLLVTGCGGPTPPANETPAASLPDSFPTDPNRAIFQLFPKGGFMPPIYHTAQAPTFTLLADGRLITLDREADGTTRRLFVSQVPKEKLPSLYADLQKAMEGVEGHYEAGTWTDDATTEFRFWTPNGTQAGDVYGFNPEPQEYENRLAGVDQLRTARRLIAEAVGEERTPYVARSVRLVVERWETPSDWKVADWPAEFPALPEPEQEGGIAEQTIAGEAAQAIIQQVPYEGRTLYKSGEGYYYVFAIPAVPLIR